MKKGMKALAAATAVIALVAAPAMSASATVSKNGTKTCTSASPYSWVQSYATGTVHQTAPGSGTHSYINFGTWKYHTDQGANYGGAWSVSTDGALDDPGTYAYCTNYS